MEIDETTLVSAYAAVAMIVTVVVARLMYEDRNCSDPMLMGFTAGVLWLPMLLGVLWVCLLIVVINSISYISYKVVFYGKPPRQGW